jgi:hypothetical protein
MGRWQWSCIATILTFVCVVFIVCSVSFALEVYRVEDVTDPTLSRQSAHRWLQGCQPYAPAALYSPRNIIIFLFLVFISVRELRAPQAIVRPERLGKLKKKIA